LPANDIGIGALIPLNLEEHPSHAVAVGAEDGYTHPRYSRSGKGRLEHYCTSERAQAWRSVETSRHPLQEAKEALDVAVPALTGDPAGGTEVLLERHDGREELESLTEPELLMRVARAMCITNILVCKPSASDTAANRECIEDAQPCRDQNRPLPRSHGRR